MRTCCGIEPCPPKRGPNSTPHNRRVLAGDYDPDGDCIWLDPNTRRCRWYEHRPQICRDYEMGGASCLAEREQGKAAFGAARAPGEGAL